MRRNEKLWNGREMRHLKRNEHLDEKLKEATKCRTNSRRSHTIARRSISVNMCQQVGATVFQLFAKVFRQCSAVLVAFKTNHAPISPSETGLTPALSSTLQRPLRLVVFKYKLSFDLKHMSKALYVSSFFITI